MYSKVFSAALIAMSAKAVYYTFGNDCTNLQDEGCALYPTCDSCKFSWPTDDPDKWDSSAARCRCWTCEGGCPKGSPKAQS